LAKNEKISRDYEINLQKETDRHNKKIEKMRLLYENKIEINNKKYQNNLEFVLQTDADPFTKIKMMKGVVSDDDYYKVNKYYQDLDYEQEFNISNNTCKKQIDLSNLKVNRPDCVNAKHKRQTDIMKKIVQDENVMEAYKSNLSMCRFIQDKILYFIIKNKMHKTMDILETFTINTKTKVNDLDTENGYFYLTPDLYCKIDIKQNNYQYLRAFIHPFNILFNRDIKCIKYYLEGSFPYIKCLDLTRDIYKSIVNGVKIHHNSTARRMKIERISKGCVYEYEKFMDKFAERPVIPRIVGTDTDYETSSETMVDSDEEDNESKTIEEPEVIVSGIVEEPEVIVSGIVEEPEVIVSGIVEEPEVIVSGIVEEPEVIVEVAPAKESNLGETYRKNYEIMAKKFRGVLGKISEDDANYIGKCTRDYYEFMNEEYTRLFNNYGNLKGEESSNCMKRIEHLSSIMETTEKFRMYV
jgi:hypothetical protein